MSNPSSSAPPRNPQIQVHHAPSSRPSSSFSPSSPNIVTRVPNARTARSPTNRSGHGHRYEHPREREVEREIVESEEVWENQRGTTLFGKPKFSSKSLLPTDRGPFSDVNGNFKLEKEKIQLPSPEWSWISDWAVDFSGDVDSEGWMYAFNFGNFPWSSNCGMTSYVRRRRWLRLRQKTVKKKVESQISISRSTEGGAGEVKEGLAVAREWLGEGVVREVRTGRLDRERLEILRKGVNEVFDNLKATSPTQSGSDKGKGNDHPHDQNQNKELQLLAIEKVFGSRVNEVLVSRVIPSYLVNSSLHLILP
ncbi:hypothetical protein BKA69DRAFT_1062590, partial [Paraphysoderma sedebokerense]